ncbi:MAG: bifunctional hydroxymethylpyrimidine kinase/phosphomethylpyrimidine kinase [Tuberibacillus sp.]
MKTCLTIAGSDSSGGAGIQADLKTFSALGVFGMSVITAVTAQNTLGVYGVQEIARDLIEEQIDAIYKDIPTDFVKIGMLSNNEAIEAITKKLEHYQPRCIVLDPVMISKSGYSLLQPTAKGALVTMLLPLAEIITPNLPEASVLVGENIASVSDMEKAAKQLVKMGPRAALVKGGHLDGEPVDVLFDGNEIHYLKGKRIDTKNTHGTGCTLSSAICAELAKGFSMLDAVANAKNYIQGAIAHALDLGSGAGPTHHFYQWYGKDGVKVD